MAHVISFRTARFEPAKETPNPINPIAGQALLLWLRERLSGAGWTASEPAAEDWGWYMDVARDGAHYLVGASGEVEPADAQATAGRDIEWVVQIERHRSFIDRLFGRNKLADDEPLSVLLERWLGAEPDFREVDVDRRA